ncbi:type II toxin-antitoxin system RelE/ParE family toxin [Sulfitobacter sp. 1A15299]|uniref:type II toxin-antitoxin system RelE/ParE family toxin n=1 Tax=Sulfitobacter sp. 1A15299 TaxID=3368598 RepID=UPI003745E235
MTDHAKPVVPRLAASHDIEAAVDYLAREADYETAMRFIDAFEAACLHISTHPASGSPRFGWDLGRPGLRVWPVKGFGYLAFYSEEDDVVDLWRVLHGARDIPASLRDVIPE